MELNTKEIEEIKLSKSELVTTAGYMGEIYKYLTDEQNIQVIQRVHKAAYVKHVPPIVKPVKIVFFVPFPYFPKLLPKHEFLNIVRTMNPETHQYLGE